MAHLSWRAVGRITKLVVLPVQSYKCGHVLMVSVAYNERYKSLYGEYRFHARIAIYRCWSIRTLWWSKFSSLVNPLGEFTIGILPMIVVSPVESVKFHSPSLFTPAKTGTIVVSRLMRSSSTRRRFSGKCCERGTLNRRADLRHAATDPIDNLTGDHRRGVDVQGAEDYDCIALINCAVASRQASKIRLLWEWGKNGTISKRLRWENRS